MHDPSEAKRCPAAAAHSQTQKLVYCKSCFLSRSWFIKSQNCNRIACQGSTLRNEHFKTTCLLWESLLRTDQQWITSQTNQMNNKKIQNLQNTHFYLKGKINNVSFLIYILFQDIIIYSIGWGSCIAWIASSKVESI